MKINTYIYSLLLLFCLTSSYGQSGKAKQAKKAYDSYAFKDAIATYESLTKKGYTDQKVYQELGDANYLNANYEEAAKWYGQLLGLDTIPIKANYYYRYAQSLKSLKKYKESDVWMEKYTALSKKDRRAVKFNDNKDYLENIKKNSGRYEVVLADINSKSSDFAPSFYGDKLVFSSARDTGITTRRIHDWNNTAFLNLYSGTIMEDGTVSKAKRFSKNLNAKTHESSTVFTKDGKTVYFTRNNSENGKKFKRDEGGVSRLKIFMADLVDDKWINIKSLPFNSDDYSTAHPTLDSKEEKLFFASDMPGTYGASDIWVVDILDNENFGNPVNLGPGINTEARETFPFMTKNNVLYFASDGHPGLGGLDIFASEAKQGKYEEVLNLGEPINSDEDDFSFIFNSDDKKGYFASNRPNGVGDDDIYSFVETEPLKSECISNISGTVTNSENGTILTNIPIDILDMEGNIVGTTASNENGAFSIPFECDGDNYVAVGKKENFIDGRTPFIINQSQENDHIEVVLQPIELEKEEEKALTLTESFALRPIYFAFDKADVNSEVSVSELDRVLDYMNRFPEAKILIKSHTDSRGSAVYNQKLSEKRAKTTLDYLVNRGIDAERLSAKGYGETELLNECEDGVKCSREAHNLNRRSEFVLVN